MILLKILGLLNLLILMTKFSILIFLIVFLDPFINSPFESKSLITLFIAGVNSGDWNTAAVEMMDSRWARQVGDRAVRLKNRILTLA